MKFKATLAGLGLLMLVALAIFYSARDRRATTVTPKEGHETKTAGSVTHLPPIAKSGTSKSLPFADRASSPSIDDKPTEQLSVLNASTEQRRAIYGKLVQKKYESFLKSLGLHPDKLQRVEALIVERYLAVFDVREANPDGWTKAQVRFAQAEVTDSIGEITDPNTFRIIKSMLEAGQSFVAVQTAYAPAMESIGSPLSPDKKIMLAEILHRNYPANRDKDPEALTVNAGGLSRLDEKTLMSTRAFLTENQCAVLSGFLAASTKSAVRISKLATK